MRSSCLINSDAHILTSLRCYRILPPLLRAFNTLPPSFPAPLTAPMTHVIHALITIPVSSSLRSVWLPPAKISPSSTPKPTGSSEPSSSQPSTSKASRSSSSSRAGSPTTGPGKDPKPGAFDRAWSALSAGRRSLSRSSSPHTSSTPVDVLLRAYDLLDVSLNHYMPDAIDPDDIGVRQRCVKEMDQSLDDVMAPLVVLITKLCQADEGSRTRMRQWLLPEDLDRTSPLEGRADLLGRLLRSLSSVHHVKLKNGVGEMLYAICDSDGMFTCPSSMGLVTNTCVAYVYREHARVIRGLRKRRWLPLQQRHYVRTSATLRVKRLCSYSHGRRGPD